MSEASIDKENEIREELAGELTKEQMTEDEQMEREREQEEVDAINQEQKIYEDR